MPKRSDSVTVLIVSYNTRDATIACLEALRRSEDVRLQVVVADNDSLDGSAEAIEATYPEVELVRCRANLGFGRANNLALTRAQAEYLLLLNPDCFVTNSTIAICRAFLENHPDASAVACQLRRPDGTVQHSCRRFPSVAGELARVILPFQLLQHVPFLGSYYLGGWGHDDTRKVDQPAGAYLMTRVGKWGEGALFDEQFFMYYEDVDLCRRLWKQGPIWFLPDAQAVHIGERSTGRARVAMASELAISRYRYFKKWHGLRSARMVAVFAAVASAFRGIAWSCAGLASIGSEPRTKAAAHWRAARSSLATLKRG